MGFWDKILGVEEPTIQQVKEEKVSVSSDEEYIKFLKDVKAIFPSESLGDIVSFFKDLKGLLPLITSTDRLNGGLYDLKNAIGIVYQMMYGDSIEQHMAVNMRYPQAEESLRKLATKVNEDVIIKLRDTKRDLKDEITTLTEDKARLEEENAGLLRNQQSIGEKVEELDEQVKDLESQRAQLETELNRLEKTGRQEVEALVEARRKELDAELLVYQKQVDADKKSATNSIKTEIASLEARKKDLTNVISALETSLSSYDKRIASLSQEESDVTVKWEPIKDDDPIYSITRLTINDYYNVLLKKYSSETGCTIAEAKEAFLLNCPNMKQLINAYAGASDEYNSDTTRRIMDASWSLSPIVRSIINNMTMPVYVKSKSNIANASVPVATKAPENLQALLRELDLQKKLIQVSADARIYQAYATTLIQILASVTPPDMDLSNLLSTYGLSDDYIKLISAPLDDDKLAPRR